MGTALSRREFCGRAAAATIFSLWLPSLEAKAADCPDVDPRDGFQSEARVIGYLIPRIRTQRGWDQVLDRISHMSDYQQSWIATVFPKLVSGNVPARDALHADNINTRRDRVINHLYSKEPYKSVLGTINDQNPRPSSRLVANAIAQVDRDDDIPAAFRNTVKEGLRLQSWNYTTTKLALDQATLLEEAAPQQARMLRSYILGQQGLGSLWDVMIERLECDGKRAPSGGRFVPPTIRRI